MGPPRKSRSINKQHINEASPSKDGDSSKRSNSRKRKLSDMLGPQWSQEELIRFYEAFRKYGKDWKKVANAVRNRSIEMAEALYTMNRAYLSLPEGTASKAGLIAMMTDHYSNLAGSDSEQESNDGAGSYRKSQKRARGKITTKASDDQVVSPSQTIASNYGGLSVLKKKRTGGTRPRPVGKRTPRFPVSFSYENNNEEKYFSPARQGLKIKGNDDEVAHEVAIALAEASQRGGSPQVSRTPSRRAENVMSSPFRNAQRKLSIAELNNAKVLDEDDFEGSTEADTGELPMYRSSRQKGRKLVGKKFEVDNKNENRLGNIKEECSGTEEGLRLGAMRGKFDVEVRPSQRKKSKKVLFEKDEDAAFDALQTLADLSLMMPTENDDESRVQFKDEDVDHVDESGSLETHPVNPQKEKRKSLGVRTKGYQSRSNSGVASNKKSKAGKLSVFDDNNSVSQENQETHQSIIRTAKKKQKMQATKIQKTETHSDIHFGESPGLEARDTGKNLTSKSKKTSQNGSPKLMKISENSSTADPLKEGSDSAQSGIQAPVTDQTVLPTKVRSRRKMDLKKPHARKDSKFSDKISNESSSMPFVPLNNDAAFNSEEKLSNCLLNQRLRRWCTYEWLYSAIDSPWFAKKEFVEYLYHVGLGHVPRLTRVEWDVIKSSLGKPRRFSQQFLKEEKEKLNAYRDSVRKHYTELREGVKEGLATDLAKPLTVGQRVIAIHPKTREIHDGSVLTVDHLRCRVQFDRHDLGVEFVMDIDCMPLSPFENMPSIPGKNTSVNILFENLNELKINGQAKEYMKLSSGEIQLSPLANSASLFNQTKGNSNAQQTAYSQPCMLSQVQAKEADIQALTELTRALDKKDAIVLELRNMNDDVLENQKDGDGSLKDSESFKMQYAAVLVQLNEVNDQVASALYCLRQRNTYQGNPVLKPIPNFVDAPSQTHESRSHVNEIIDSSKTKARTLVDAAIQALSTLKGRDSSFEKIEEAVDYVSDHLPTDDSAIPMAPNSEWTIASDIETQIPSDLITRCIATLLMIQKCTERQSPPEDVAKILDSAVTSLRPCSSQNLPVYDEIQKCMGIIKNQILALIPT